MRVEGDSGKPDQHSNSFDQAYAETLDRPFRYATWFCANPAAVNPSRCSAIIWLRGSIRATPRSYLDPPSRKSGLRFSARVTDTNNRWPNGCETQPRRAKKTANRSVPALQYRQVNVIDDNHSSWVHPLPPRSNPQLLIGRKADLHAKDHRGRTPLQFTNNRRCKERLREAERKEERAALEQRRQSEERERERALKRREEQILERLDLRSRARLAGGVR